ARIRGLTAGQVTKGGATRQAKLVRGLGEARGQQVDCLSPAGDQLQPDDRQLLVPGCERLDRRGAGPDPAQERISLCERSPVAPAGFRPRWPPRRTESVQMRPP